MFVSTPRFTRALTAAVLATGFVASAQARPSDPRQTIPSLITKVAPQQVVSPSDELRWVGPRNTIALRK